MATLQVRTTLANGASTTVDTSASQNIVVNVVSGIASIEAIIDSAQTDGYRFKLDGGAEVVSSAASLIVTGAGENGCVFEVYAP